MHFLSLEELVSHHLISTCLFHDPESVISSTEGVQLRQDDSSGGTLHRITVRTLRHLCCPGPGTATALPMFMTHRLPDQWWDPGLGAVSELSRVQCCIVRQIIHKYFKMWMMRHASRNECTLSKYVYVWWLGEVVGKKRLTTRERYNHHLLALLCTVFLA